jgi:hypothetical protein
MTMRLPAIAPRVAKTTQSAVAANTSPRMTRPTPLITSAIDDSRCSHSPWSSRLAVGTSSFSRRASVERSASSATRTAISRGIGSSDMSKFDPSQGFRRSVDCLSSSTVAAVTPRTCMAISAARATVAAISVPSVGFTWIVTSSAICRCQPWARSTTTATAATERQERKAMMATSVSSERRATVRGGTIGLALRGADGRPPAAGLI